MDKNGGYFSLAGEARDINTFELQMKKIIITNLWEKVFLVFALHVLSFLHVRLVTHKP